MDGPIQSHCGGFVSVIGQALEVKRETGEFGANAPAFK
jgi:hypothetical protein